MARQNTQLESAGAEFLVLGNLLIEGIQTYKSYTNHPGYDLISTNPKTKKVCRIQVKSRWATDYDRGFPIKNLECDFVVFTALNRGYRYRKKQGKNDGRKGPDYFVLPIHVVKKARKKNSTWGKVFLHDIPNCEYYLGNWNTIKKSLQ